VTCSTSEDMHLTVTMRQSLPSRQRHVRYYRFAQEALRRKTTTCSYSISFSCVPKSALPRSPLLADLNTCDPEGRLRLPFSSRTWEAWLADDPTELGQDFEQMLQLLKVRDDTKGDMHTCRSQCKARKSSTLLCTPSSCRLHVTYTSPSPRYRSDNSSSLQ
jgi:hypothetical protein